MENHWGLFIELIGQLRTASPGLVDLVVKYNQSKDRAVLESLQREFASGCNGDTHASVVKPTQPNLVNLPLCLEVLDQLRTQEDVLKDQQVKITEQLVQVQSATKEFEAALRYQLRAEQRALLANLPAEVVSSDEEILAGLREIKEKGGYELREILNELFPVGQDRERIPS